MRVLVTGGASGLGLAIAEAVNRSGGQAFVLDRQQVAGNQISNFQVDLLDSESTRIGVMTAINEMGGLDAVVTAAGIDACGPLEKVSEEDWERVIGVNLMGTARVIRYALPALRESRGRIITIASTLGLRALPEASAYCASKFAVVGLTRSLAAELKSEVGVSMLIPGGMKTHFFDGREAKYQPGPDAELQQPEDVAFAVLAMLQQPLSSQMREVVVVPGGETSWP